MGIPSEEFTFLHHLLINKEHLAVTHKAGQQVSRIVQYCYTQRGWAAEMGNQSSYRRYSLAVASFTATDASPTVARMSETCEGPSVPPFNGTKVPLQCHLELQMGQFHNHRQMG